ncbi:MAG: 4'-phosphopantetheinyl transferase family protein [Streptosporangiaceae bacterium]
MVLGAILPSGVAVAEAFGSPDENPDHLLAPERAAVATAAPKRRREFAAVRACARRALAELGVPPAAVLPGPSGEPSWPPGIVGSMTHCAGYRACAVARAGRFAAIGIDAEPHAPLPDGVLAMVTSDSERAALAELAAAVPGACWDRILFCAKEAVYKAWFPATGRWLGFSGADVRIDPGGTFQARLLVPGPVAAGHQVAAYDGRWQVARDLIATAVVVAASGISSGAGEIPPASAGS